MNGDMISREAAKKTVRFECGEWAGLAKTIIKGLDALPAAQPRRLRGRWVETERRGVLAGAKYYKCDICAQPIVVVDSTPITYGYNYCPRCGSQMEEGQDE